MNYEPLSTNGFLPSDCEVIIQKRTGPSSKAGKPRPSLAGPTSIRTAPNQPGGIRSTEGERWVTEPPGGPRRGVRRNPEAERARRDLGGPRYPHKNGLFGKRHQQGPLQEGGRGVPA